MRELTLNGFLTGYVRSLSKTNTTSVRRLAQEAATDNPRLREPLFLYATLTGKEELLRSAAQDHGLLPFYEPMMAEYDRRGLETAMQNGAPLPDGYEKVRRSYLSRKNRQISDNDTKELMRKKIHRLQKQYGVSNYRIYTDLSYNPGNLNAWLKHGASEKVSLDTARKILKYMEQYKQ